MKKSSLILVVLILLSGSWAFSQEPGTFSIHVSPCANIPFGKSSDLYKIGVGSDLNAEYVIPGLPLVFVQAGLGYSLNPTLAETTLHLVSFGAGGGLRISILPKLIFKLSALGGYSVGLYENETGTSPFYSGGAEIAYLFSRAFSLGAGARYMDYLAEGETLYRGLGVFLGASYNFGAGSTRSNIKIIDTRVDPIFPVFYKHYDDNPLGSIVIKNEEKGTIKDVKVSFYASQYMEQPKICAVLPELGRNREAEVSLYALFTDEVLQITEGTKVNSDIRIEYTYLDEVRTFDLAETLRMYDRNAMTWDDDQKAAAFVTAKDPAIMRYSKTVAGNVRGRGSRAINSNFRMVMAMFESLRLYGVNYVVDPTTPYKELSQDKVSLDYLQFPSQTMSYRGGDCDDLSILNCALLESIGIETAFITVPGHIYIAFALNMHPQEAAEIFRKEDDLIFQEGDTWVPLEITEVQNGFLTAWQIGAKEWRENEAKGSAAFYPVHKAWQSYEPVGISSGEAGIELPQSRELVSTYLETLNTFIKRELSEQEQELRFLIGQQGEKPKLINKLGVLFARYGLYDEAEVEFNRILDRRDYVPALINLGNIYYLKDNMKEALSYYEKARRLAPDNSVALLGIARANYKLENYQAVNVAYRSIEQKNPTLAARYSYLVSSGESTVRASAVLEEAALWEEE
jgi:hypothetical protein